MKKVSLCGKGGSGKSTIVSLLAIEMAKEGYVVTVVDSDESNACLHWMLGFQHPPLSLMDFLGGRAGVKEKMGPKGGNASSTPNIFSWDEILIDLIPEDYVLKKDNIRLISVGKIHQAFEGCACSMGVVSKEFLKKLKLKDKEVVLVDMEAGIEHFGRGVEMGIDSIVTVVEPSRESIDLAIKIKELSKQTRSEFPGAIINKADSEELIYRIEEELKRHKIGILGKIPFIRTIQEACLMGQQLYDVEYNGDLSKIVKELLAG